jgi:hypothetical protein
MVAAASKSPAARSASCSDQEEHKEAASPLPSAQQPAADLPDKQETAVANDLDDKAAFAVWTADSSTSTSPRPDEQVSSSTGCHAPPAAFSS